MKKKVTIDIRCDCDNHGLSHNASNFTMLNYYYLNGFK